MSAPDTNIERQARRHKPSLAGITTAGGAVVIVVLVLALWPDPLADDAPLPETTTEITQ
ncbi:MAG: hypothetical protein ACU0GG_12250 [Paracoccaceae bacterium]